MSKALMVSLAGAAAWGTLALASMLSATDGHLSMPLDDAYIFFQYARQVAGGAPLTYQDGGEISAGATSLLTVILHTLGYLAGFRGAWLALFAVISGVALLAWSAWSAYRIGMRLCPGVPWLPTTLVLTSGSLGWGFLSGMDVPLVVALSLAAVAAWPEPGSPPPRRLFVFTALLGLARPEGLVLVLIAAALGMYFPRRRGWLVSIAFALAPGLLYWAASGTPRSASMDVKSILGEPDLSLGDWILSGTSHVQEALTGILGGGAVGDASRVAANDGSAIAHFIVPFSLGFLLIGLVPEAWSQVRERKPGPALLITLWIVTLLGAVSFVVPRTWHWHRYWMPMYPLALLGVSAGVERLGQWIDASRPQRPGDGARAIGVALALLSLPSVGFFLVAYGRNCADIYFQHIELAQRLETGDPVRPRALGLHDAGALTYFSTFPVVDLEGLVSEDFRAPARLGGAGVWERLETLPEGERPDVLALYPNWFEAEFTAPHRLIGSQRLFRPSIAAGNPLNLYLADWSLAGSGDLPRSPQVLAQVGGMDLKAEVDVADLSSETTSRYRLETLDGASRGILRRLRMGDGEAGIDGGRLVSGSETFRLSGLTAGAPLALVLRTHAPFRIVVEANGAAAGIWADGAPSTGAWNESVFRIPGEQVESSELRVTVTSGDRHHAAYGSFHYWAFQPRGGAGRATP